MNRNIIERNFFLHGTFKLGTWSKNKILNINNLISGSYDVSASLWILEEMKKNNKIIEIIDKGS